MPNSESARMWRVPELDGLRLARATYITHAFARHVHDYFVIGVIEAGVQSFDYRGARHFTPAGAVFLINPGEPHTGQSGIPAGYTYRTLYPDPELLQRAASEAAGRRREVPFFRAPVVADGDLVQALWNLHVSLEAAAPALERESRLLAAFARLVTRHGDAPLRLAAVGREAPAIARVREYIGAHYAEDIKLATLAGEAGLSPYYLVRAFHKEMGLPPHAYLESIRIREAERLLAAGRPPAEVAAATGFVDQSHFTRQFRRLLGITPGRYRAQAGT